ncbi:MAG: ABC transporter permease subunit, partial [Nannocystaceae bacterium]
VRLTGASRLVVALWGPVPAAAGPMLSYTLLRLECSMRNASVIGIVGGGGLGAALFEELGFGRYDRVATLLLALLLLTGLTDAGSKLVSASLHRGGWWSRRRFAAAVGLALVGCAVVLGPALSVAVAELQRLDAEFIGATARGLVSPSLEPPFLVQLLSDAVVPLGIAVVATAAASILALGAVGLRPLRVAEDPRLPRWVRWAPRLARRGLDLAALLSRAIPDVVWLLLFGVALRVGPLAAIAAIATHSFGMLVRLFAEAVDDVREAAREVGMHGSRPTRFAWLVWPSVAPVVWTHVSLQTESNLRAGLIVGIVGAGGLGDAFHSSITFWRLGDASMQALTMVALTVLVDRLSRRAGARRARPGVAPGVAMAAVE